MPPTTKPAATKAIAQRPQGIQINTVQELMAFAEIVYRSGHRGFNKPEAVAYAIAFGLQLGIPAAVAPSLISMATGKPSADGEAALSLLKSNPACEKLDHGVKGEGDQRHGWITTKRVGETEERTTTFSVADAKRAGYWGGAHMKNQGPWVTHPDRMLRWRAIGHHAKDWWADVMCGLVVGADDAIEAEVVSVKTNSPATAPTQTTPTAPTPEAASPAAVTATTTAPAISDRQLEPITDEQKHKLVQYRNQFLKAKFSVDPADAAAAGTAWKEFLSLWKVESALAMNKAQANEALAVIYEACHTDEQKAALDNPGK